MALWFTQRGGLLTVLSTDKDYYRMGEPVRISLFKLNVSPYSLTFTYPTTQRYDFIVSGMSGELWRWSADRIFIPVVEQTTLSPGESRAYVETWLQTTNSGEGVLPGIYLISGWNTAANYIYPMTSASVIISITG